MLKIMVVKLHCTWNEMENALQFGLFKGILVRLVVQRIFTPCGDAARGMQCTTDIMSNCFGSSHLCVYALGC